ncbi:MAG TPA: hypothetical protein VGI22_17435, partial [Xanthobacteraceae bacterium]
ILNTLFKALEARGFTIKSENGRAPWVQSDKNRIEFALREHIRQTRQPVSDEEKRDPFYGGQRSKHIKTLTGKLDFKIASYLEDGIPVEWMDGDDALIEDRIGEIVAGLQQRHLSWRRGGRPPKSESDNARRKRTSDERRKRASGTINVSGTPSSSSPVNGARLTPRGNSLPPWNGYRPRRDCLQVDGRLRNGSPGRASS